VFVLIEPETITTVDDRTVKSLNAHMRLIYARSLLAFTARAE